MHLRRLRRPSATRAPQTPRAGRAPVTRRRGVAGRGGRGAAGAGGAAAQGAGGAGAKGRRTALTGRAAVLALVACALVLSLAYPVREYVEQRAQIHALQQQNAERHRHVAELEQQKRRWQDPAYVRTQARERLHFVMPGETGYVTTRGGQDAREKRAESGSSRPQASPDHQPWYTRLWGSVETASRRAPDQSTGARAGR